MCELQVKRSSGFLCLFRAGPRPHITSRPLFVCKFSCQGSSEAFLSLRPQLTVLSIPFFAYASIRTIKTSTSFVLGVSLPSWTSEAYEKPAKNLYYCPRNSKQIKKMRKCKVDVIRKNSNLSLAECVGDQVKVVLAPLRQKILK